MDKLARQATHEEQRDDQDNRERPPREMRVASVVGGLRHSVGARKKREPPPLRNSLVALHRRKVLVVDNGVTLVPRVERHDEGLDAEEMVSEPSVQIKYGTYSFQ